MTITPNTPKKPTPKGWPRMSSSVYYEDASRAIDFLCDAYGFEVRLRIEGEGGRIEHSELEYGDGLVMIGSVGGKTDRAVPLPTTSPKLVGGKNTQAICVFVDDVDAHCEHARKHGATIVEEPTTNDYGPEYWADRTYRTEDTEGHHWWFMQRMRTGAGTDAK